ncbi:hypothetical protein A2U01_0063150, partial [Trifolium medium]|nr:hypothetical protein [Trifolium medium]
SAPSRLASLSEPWRAQTESFAVFPRQASNLILLFSLSETFLAQRGCHDSSLP